MIRQACEADLPQAERLARELWGLSEEIDLQKEWAQLKDGVLFIARKQDEIIAFALCQLRHDYVEGTDSSPVGYLEGIYVVERFRREGVALELLAACEQWSREQGCTEFASDCVLDNDQSIRFHLSAGFAEANRIVCFAKKL